MFCSIAIVKFPGFQPEAGGLSSEWYLVVGGALEQHLQPFQSPNGGWLQTYCILDDGRKLELLHQTQIEEIPTALCPFQSKLLVGIGRLLRFYDLGKKKLLRKDELRVTTLIF